jgi:hypothetical protein
MDIGAMGQRVLDPLRWLDRGVKDFSGSREAIAREVQQRANQETVMKGGNEREVGERIIRGGAATVGTQTIPLSFDRDAKLREAFIGRLAQDLQTEPGRKMVADTYGPNMARGPGGLMRKGIMESVHGAMASNAYVRRGVLGGGAVMGGVGMTAGAQQLMALMQYMQSGQENEASREQPLTS